MINTDEMLHVYDAHTANAIKFIQGSEDDYKGYTLSNIRLVTWKENFEKYLEDKKNGINNKNSKPVNQLSLESKLIQKFSSQVEASRITGINKNCISQCCLRNIKTSGGYIWRYSI